MANKFFITAGLPISKAAEIPTSTTFYIAAGLQPAVIAEISAEAGGSLGGSADVSSLCTMVALGGGSLDGSADESFNDIFVPTNGAILDGTATSFPIFNNETTGGVLLDGTTTIGLLKGTNLLRIPSKSIRPDDFKIDHSHPLARDLFYGGFGQYPDSSRYHDSSIRAHPAVIVSNDPTKQWSHGIGRRCVKTDYLIYNWYDTVSLPFNTVPQTHKTIACWAKNNGTGTSCNVFGSIHQNYSSGAYGYGISLAANQIPHAICSNGSTTVWENVYGSRPLDDWMHLLITTTGSGNDQTISLYVNGTLETSYTGTLNFSYNYGCHINYDNGAFKGFVADPVVYTRVLPLPEIQQLADPSNVFLSGMIQPPSQQYWVGFSSLGSGNTYDETGQGGMYANGLSLVYTQERYWVGTSENWSDSTNWAGSSGEPGGIPVPDTNSDVYFDSTVYTDCTVDADATCNSLTMSQEYDGTLDVNGFNFTVGDINVGNSLPVAYSGHIYWGEGNINVSGNIIVYRGNNTDSWNCESSQWFLSGSSKECSVYYGNKQFACGLTIQSGASYTFGSTFSYEMGTGINGFNSTFTVEASAALTLNNSFNARYGSITVNGTIDGGSQLIWQGYNSAHILTIGGSGSIACGSFRLGCYRGTIAAPCEFDCPVHVSYWGASLYYLQAGDYTFNYDTTWDLGGQGTWNATTVDANYTFFGSIINTSSALAYNKSNGTITFDGSADQTADFFDGTIEEIHVDKDAGTVLFNNGFTSDAFLMDSTNTGGVDFGDGTSTFIFAGDFDIQCTSGSVDLGAADISVGGDWLNNPFAGTWTYGTSTVRFAGTSKTFFPRFSNDIYHLVVEGTYAANTNERLEVVGSLTISAGARLTFNGTSYTTCGNVPAVVDGTLDGNTTSGSSCLFGDLTVNTTGSVTVNTLIIRNSDVTINGNGVLSPTNDITFKQDVVIQGSATTIVIDTPTILFQHEGGDARSITVSTPLQFTGNVEFLADDVDGYTVDLNADMDFQGDVTVTETLGVLSWSKGTNTLFFTGNNSQNVDLNYLLVEDIDIDKTAGTLTFTDGLATDSLAITDGTVDFSTNTFDIYESWSGYDSTNVDYSNANIYLIGPQIYPSLGSGASGTAEWSEVSFADETMDGGVLINGTASVTESDIVVIEGAAVIGDGTADIQVAYAVDATGGTNGVLLDGTASISLIINHVELSGGASVDGTALVYTQERYWVGTSANWSDTTNWAGASEETGGIPVPDSNSDVYFDSDSYTDCTIDTAANCQSFTKQSTYSGTISMAAALEVTNDLILQTNGTFRLGTIAGQTLTVGGDTTMDCSMICGAAAVNINGSLDIGCTSFTKAFGIWTLSGVDATFAAIGYMLPWRLTIAEGASYTTATSFITNTTSGYTNQIWNIAGTWTVNNTVYHRGAFHLLTTGSLTGTGTFINYDGTFDNSANGLWDIAHTYIRWGYSSTVLNSGTYSSPTITAYSTRAANNGGYVLLNGDVIFDGDVSFTYGSGGTGNQLNLNGHNSEFRQNLTIQTGAGYLKSAGTITFNGTNDRNVSVNNNILDDVIVDMPTGTLTLTSDLVTESLTITDGTVDFGSTTCDIYNDWSGYDSTNVDYNNATIYLLGPQIYPVVGSGVSGLSDETFNDVVQTSGGMLSNGNVDIVHIYNETMSGGAKVGSFAIKFDFGTATSPVTAGYTKESAEDYDSNIGWGWVAGTPDTRDRATGDDLARDFAFGTDVTFGLDCPNGSYAIKALIGDTTYTHDNQKISIEGNLLETFTTVNETVWGGPYYIDVSDGQLTIRMYDLAGGADPNACIAALEVDEIVATLNVQFKEDPTGGAYANGEADESFNDFIEGLGGVSGSGIADAIIEGSYHEIMLGGITVDGTPEPQATYLIVPENGCLLNGESDESFNDSIETSGGVSGSGIASVDVLRNIDTSGGALISHYDHLTIDFNDYSFAAYGGSAQDVNGTITISDEGETFKLVGNSWKSTSFPYVITSNTRMTFNFKSAIEGEVHAIGLVLNNSILDPSKIFKVFGTQAYGVLTYDNYVDPDWKSYTISGIPTGSHSYLIFGMDKDSGEANAESIFSKLRIFENNIESTNYTNVFNPDVSGGAALSGSADESTNYHSIIATSGVSVDGTAFEELIETDNTYNEVMLGGVLTDGTSTENFQDLIEVSGGSYTSGLSDIAVSYEINAFSGIVTDGTSDIAVSYEINAFSGVVADGTSDPQVAYLIAPENGALLNGEADEHFNDSIETSGGASCSGVAEIIIEGTYNEVMLGGVLTDGTSTENFQDFIEVSGGSYTSGLSDITIGYNLDATAGISVDGTAFEEFIGTDNTYNETMLGGALTSGIAEIKSTYNEAMSGIILLGGLSDTQTDYVNEVTGGVLLNGGIDAYTLQTEVPENGVVTEGEGNNTLTCFPETLGGANVNGTAEQTFIDFVEGNASVVLGGEAAILSQGRYDETMSGGIAAGGLSPFILIKVEVGESGAKVSGTNDSQLVNIPVISGGMLSSGLSPHNFIDFVDGSGSPILAGGTAEVTQKGVFYEVATGGSLVGGIGGINENNEVGSGGCSIGGSHEHEYKPHCVKSFHCKTQGEEYCLQPFKFAPNSSLVFKESSGYAYVAGIIICRLASQYETFVEELDVQENTQENILTALVNLNLFEPTKPEPTLDVSTPTSTTMLYTPAMAALEKAETPKTITPRDPTREPSKALKIAWANQKRNKRCCQKG